MNELSETSRILGDKYALDGIEMTTRLVEPQVEDLTNISVSRIPKQYHITKTFPIFPKDYADQGYRVYNKDGLWNVVIWPSNNPNSREDALHLSDAVRLMLDEIQGDISAKIVIQQQQNVQKSKAAAAQLIQLFERRISLLKVALDELTRQVSKHCTERGSLLAFLIDNLLSTFKEIPGHYNNALKLLKKEVDQLAVALDAKNLELQSQSKELNEKIQLMVIERRMEKEWHNTLESQITKWKQQVESYKKKTQEQLKNEKDMFDQQISNMENAISDLRQENDGLKEQIQYQRSELIKSEKKCAELEQQLLKLNKKNEKLQIQISKHGNSGGDHEDNETDSSNDVQNDPYELSDESKLKRLLNEFSQTQQKPLLNQKDLTNNIFMLFDNMYNTQSNMPFDDFYASRLLFTEDTPQSAADSARSLLDSLLRDCDDSPLAQLTLDLIRRKMNDSILMIIINFWGFFRAQPFKGNITVDKTNDVPIIPLNTAYNLVTSMFSDVMGESTVNEMNKSVQERAQEERGNDPNVSIVSLISVIALKIQDFYSKKVTDIQNSFTRTYIRYQKAISQRLRYLDLSAPRMDWKTFKDFMKMIRPELAQNHIESMFLEATEFSDSLASITADAFDTICVTKHVYVNTIKVPGSGRRLRYVPPDITTIIETVWKSSLKTSVEKAITELSKNENSTIAVTTLRNLDQKFEDTLKTDTAGPFCVQLLHETARIISNEAVNIASSLPIDKCLLIMEKQICVLNTDQEQK